MKLLTEMKLSCMKKVYVLLIYAKFQTHLLFFVYTHIRKEKI